jgi:hypothetical protein
MFIPDPDPGSRGQNAPDPGMVKEKKYNENFYICVTT